MILTKDHMTSTFDMLDFAAREPDSPTSKVFLLLADCWPTGRSADMEQATMKQLHYIRTLAGLDFDGPFSEGWDLVVDAQGQQMSKTQAGHIIGKLLVQKASQKHLS
jgi:hypothetical protein